MNAHGGCFAELNIDDRAVTLFCFVKEDKLFVVELTSNDSLNGNRLKVQTPIQLEQKNDFIVSLVPSKKYGCIYAISKLGMLFVYDIQTGTAICSQNVSDEYFNNPKILLAVPHPETGG
eukprot:331039_1